MNCTNDSIYEFNGIGNYKGSFKWIYITILENIYYSKKRQ